MSITDYASLKTAIADWSHRADLTSYMDDFIRLAEQRMSGELRVRELEATATGNLSGVTLALPSDFAELRRFSITTTGKYSPEMIGADGLRSKYQTASGLPDYYALVGGNIEFERTPDSAYAYALDYYKKPVAITSPQARAYSAMRSIALRRMAVMGGSTMARKLSGPISIRPRSTLARLRK